jgi:hypothetical protein
MRAGEADESAYWITFRLRSNLLACSIHSGSGAPSRCLPPAQAAAQAATAPSSVAAAKENARMIVLCRDRAIAAFESANHRQYGWSSYRRSGFLIHGIRSLRLATPARRM